MLIVGGPNGSGKTTIAREYSSEFRIPYVGADAIAEALNPDNPAAARIAACRQFIATVDQLLIRGDSFVCETTLSGLTTRKFILSARAAGYSVGIAFLCVESVDICVARVAERVRKGGHYVPEPDIHRRFVRSMRNFWEIYRELADHWVLLYNGLPSLQDVAAGSGGMTSVRDPVLYATLFGHPR